MIKYRLKIKNKLKLKKNINRKMKQKALTMVLSGKVKDENFVVLEKFEAGDYKTKIINEMLFNFHKNILKEEKEKLNILVITDKNDEKVKYSMKNIVGVKIINSNNINILELLKEQYGGVKEIKTEDKKVKKDKK